MEQNEKYEVLYRDMSRIAHQYRRELQEVREQLHHATAEIQRVYNAAGKQEQDIINLLGPVLGFPTGPFPQMCSACSEGPCTNEEVCKQECLSAPYTAEELAATLVQQLHHATAEAAAARREAGEAKKSLYDALKALAGMYAQYCRPVLGSHPGHMWMSAGEEAEDVLFCWGLMRPDETAIDPETAPDEVPDKVRALLAPPAPAQTPPEPPQRPAGLGEEGEAPETGQGDTQTGEVVC